MFAIFGIFAMLLLLAIFVFDCVCVCAGICGDIAVIGVGYGGVIVGVGCCGAVVIPPVSVYKHHIHIKQQSLFIFIFNACINNKLLN